MRAMSAAAQRRVLAMPGFKAAGAVACYLAAPGETRTDLIVRQCRRLGKRVFVPAWSAARGRYVLALLGRNAALRAGPHGMPEPAAAGRPAPRRIDLVIVPGLAFDAAGNRLGRGGGHYDSLLRRPGLRRAFKAGLAFDFQVVAAVPAGRLDVKMDAVVTESGATLCGETKRNRALARRR